MKYLNVFRTELTAHNGDGKTSIFFFNILRKFCFLKQVLADFITTSVLKTTQSFGRLKNSSRYIVS